MDKLIINGTEYELECVGSRFESSTSPTPRVMLGGKDYIGKAIPNYPPKDYEVLQYTTEDEIYSVKRLSDGEVFTVGEVTGGYSYDERPIEKFIIIGDTLYARQRYGNTKLAAIKKIKLPLFITEDGVSAYEADKDRLFYIVFADYSTASLTAVDAYNAQILSPTAKIFFFLNHANNYAKNKKPRFSFSQIRDIINKNIQTSAIKENIYRDLSEL